MPIRIELPTEKDDSFMEADVVEMSEEDRAKLARLRATTEEAFAALDRGEGIRLNSPADVDAYMDGIVSRRQAARG